MYAALPAPATARARWLGLSIVYAAFAVMLAWTWRQWADAAVDFGGEVYVAWRITAGDVLYRDLAYFTGPLSPYLNAFWFECLGVDVMTLAFVNIALTAAILALLHGLLVRIASVFAATGACVVVVALCYVALHQGAGNYNFIWPYSHEMVHGTLLTLATWMAFQRWCERATVVWATFIGLLFGLVALTKVEFTVALGAGLAAGVLCAPVERRTKLAHAGLAVAFAAVPFAIAATALNAAMPLDAALRGALGAWVYVGDERVSGFPLYRVAMGLQPLGEHVRNIALWSAGSVAWVLALRELARRTPVWTPMLASAIAAALVFASLDWTDAFYPLVLYMAWAAWWSWSRRRADAVGPLRIAFCVFALLLLARIALNARVQFYGFALAAPAVAVLTVLLLDWVPRELRERANALRLAALPLLGVVVAGHLVAMGVGMRWNTQFVGTAADRLRVGPKGEFIQRALEYVETQCAADGTVLVLPEGALLNYLARRKSPTRYFSLMPPELAMFSEESVARDLAQDPPNFVVLLHRDTLEYGVPYFGKDYARTIYAWVRANYKPVQLWSVVPGQKPFEPGTAFAVAVLEHKP